MLGFGHQFLLLLASAVDDFGGRRACLLHDRLRVGDGTGADLGGFGLGVRTGLVGVLFSEVQDLPQTIGQGRRAVGELVAYAPKIVLYGAELFGGLGMRLRRAFVRGSGGRKLAFDPRAVVVDLHAVIAAPADPESTVGALHGRRVST